ncbi:DUF4188 domain-containing protein [Piscinibacter sakaiensis]|uniref:Uncharacterized protein n=1 Tax=Piscinibacter sakaiensis TaxID=1547922 RepID=A0A0K8P003_PISS1|nr:DUF4188 domain-containing protein [Piscinibacter sakaiensis]GAP35982.1 hypothetical protein ISF6_1822 [Piscinibacter sakaiensis]
MIHRQRMTARLEGEFAVFLIGMRINRPWLPHRWLPVAAAMPRMLRELYAQPALGLLSHEMWFSRTIVLLQYWRSLDALLAYARARDAAHLPAWQAFNRAIGTDGSVGIWHETYCAGPGTHENVYVNMPPFGLGRAGSLVEARGGLQSAATRLGRPPGPGAPG